MLDQQILPWLAHQYPQSDRVTIKRLQLFGIGESSIQQMVQEHIPEWPAEIELGFRAGAPSLELKISCFSDQYESMRSDCEHAIRRLFADYIFAEGDVNLQQSMVELLRSRNKKIATAESCTGGLIASMLTEISGSSAVFEGGFVTYSNRMKQQMLGVSEESLTQHGAVSEQVVLEMAAGALRRSGADYAVAVSGVAGPDGGSDAKPVGTVWIAWGALDTLQACEFYMPRARTLFQVMVAATALDLVRREILGIQTQPRYFRERAPR